MTRPAALLSPEEALTKVLTAAENSAKRIPSRDFHLSSPELDHLVLAEVATAQQDLPAFDRALRDGSAISGPGVPEGDFRCVFTVPAGRSGPALQPRECAEIMTGAPCPEGTWAVIPVEETRREGDQVHLSSASPIPKGQFISPRGCEAKAGAPVVPAGTRISPLVRAALIAARVSSVRAYSAPSLRSSPRVTKSLSAPWRTRTDRCSKRWPARSA